MDPGKFGMDLKRFGIDPGRLQLDPEDPGGSREARDGPSEIWDGSREVWDPRSSLPALTPPCSGQLSRLGSLFPPGELQDLGDPLEFGAGGTFGISWERSRSWTHIPRAGNSQKFPKVPKSQPLEEPVFHGAPFPWGCFVRSFLLPPQPLQLLCFPQIQFIGAGNGFLGIPTGFRENPPQKKEENLGLIQIFVGFSPII